MKCIWHHGVVTQMARIYHIANWLMSWFRTWSKWATPTSKCCRLRNTCLICRGAINHTGSSRQLHAWVIYKICNILSTKHIRQILGWFLILCRDTLSRTMMRFIALMAHRRLKRGMSRLQKTSAGGHGTLMWVSHRCKVSWFRRHSSGWRMSTLTVFELTGYQTSFTWTKMPVRKIGSTSTVRRLIMRVSHFYKS